MQPRRNWKPGSNPARTGQSRGRQGATSEERVDSSCVSLTKSVRLKADTYGSNRRRTLRWLVAQARPEVPARNRSIGSQRLANLREPLGARHLAQAVRALHRLQDSEVIDREHVGTMKPEHQEHLGRPSPDAFHLRQRLDYVLVRKFVHRMQRQ